MAFGRHPLTLLPTDGAQFHQKNAKYKQQQERSPTTPTICLCSNDRTHPLAGIMQNMIAGLRNDFLQQVQRPGEVVRLTLPNVLSRVLAFDRLQTGDTRSLVHYLEHRNNRLPGTQRWHPIGLQDSGGICPHDLSPRDSHPTPTAGRHSVGDQPCSGFQE
jgi:hypothetical protein